MYRSILTFAMAILCISMAIGQTINKPEIEFKNTGLYTIEKIQKNPKATVLDLRVTFLPNWWTSFDKDIYLEDTDTKKKYFLASLRGASLGKQLWTPASGDTLIQLYFPPLPKTVKQVNYGDEKTTLMFGISFKKNTNKEKHRDIPKSIQTWLDQKTATTKKEISKELNQSTFFRKDSATLVGYIKGYDKRSGFTSGIVYHQNTMTNEDLPTTIQIYPDGRFEVSLEIFHPMMNNLKINGQWFPFYIEPGETLGVILDWEDFLLLDRYRDRSYNAQYTTYLGRNKQLNEDIWNFKINAPNYGTLNDLQKNQKPEVFLQNQLQAWDKEITRIDKVLNENPKLPLANKLIRNNVNILFANHIFDYTLSRDYYSKQDTSNKVLKIAIQPTYYDFINKLDLNDLNLIISPEFSTFINRFEFSPLYSRIDFQNKENEEELKIQHFKKIYQTDTLPIVYHIARLRELKGKFNYIHSDSILNEKVQNFLSTVKQPIFHEEVQRLMQIREIKKTGYELPDTYGAKILKKIMQQHQGKVLVIDFWAQWCGPCRAGIESTLTKRKELADNKDLDFLFITDESGTPDIKFFNEYNKTNFLKNSYRVTADEYLALRELFKFNGIPRYVLVDEKGRIRDDNFASYNLSSELKRLFPEKFKDVAL